MDIMDTIILISEYLILKLQALDFFFKVDYKWLIFAKFVCTLSFCSYISIFFFIFSRKNTSGKFNKTHFVMIKCLKTKIAFFLYKLVTSRTFRKL